MAEGAGFENRYLGLPGSRVRIPPSPPVLDDVTVEGRTNVAAHIAKRRGAGAA